MSWQHFDDQAAYSAFLGELQVSKWPRANSTRRACDFRFSLGEGMPFPRPDRFLLQMEEVPDEPLNLAYPVIDLDVSGPFSLHGTSGVNEFGREVTLDVVEHLEPDFLLNSPPGIEYHFTFKMDGFDDWNSTRYWDAFKPNGDVCEIPMKVNHLDVTCPVRLEEDNPLLLNLDWPPPPAFQHWRWNAMSGCYTFPEPAPPLGMAEFNGVDAYIKLLNLITFTNNPFRLSCELRLNQTLNHWPILGRQGTGGFFGMRDDDIIFGNLTLPTTWVPVTDVWLTWVYEFEPVTLLQHKLTINGDVVRDSTNARQFVPANTVGVYRQGVGGTLWADMDLRNLKIESGTPGNYTTLLDLPCDTDACDIGPDSNHGTTFNMALPSC